MKHRSNTLVSCMTKVLQTNNVVTQSVFAITTLLLKRFLSFQYSLNDWCFLILLFVSLFLTNAQKNSSAIELMNFIQGHV